MYPATLEPRIVEGKYQEEEGENRIAVLRNTAYLPAGSSVSLSRGSVFRVPRSPRKVGVPLSTPPEWSPVAEQAALTLIQPDKVPPRPWL